MRRIRFGYANVMATIAVFIALGGTSYAVIKLPRNSVGSLQLKANAVTSAKVRNASIKRADLAASARVGSRGPRGATGPAGSAGPTGAGDIIVRARDAAAAKAPPDGSPVSVVSAALPAGRWLVFATTEVVNSTGSTVVSNFRCFIAVDGAPRGLGKVQSAGNAAGGTTASDLTLIEVVDKPGASSVALSCGHDGALDPAIDARFDRAKVVAIPVASADVKDVLG